MFALLLEVALGAGKLGNAWTQLLAHADMFIVALFVMLLLIVILANL